MRHPPPPSFWRRRPPLTSPNIPPKKQNKEHLALQERVAAALARQEQIKRWKAEQRAEGRRLFHGGQISQNFHGKIRKKIQKRFESFLRISRQEEANKAAYYKKKDEKLLKNLEKNFDNNQIIAQLKHNLETKAPKEFDPTIRRKFKREVLEKMVNGSRPERNLICEYEFMYFCKYYFPEFFTYRTPEFHFDGFYDLKFLNHKDLMWMWFRESAKTTIMKMYITYLICHKKKNYVLYVCYDSDNAERNLFDIVLWLQTNKKLIQDYGQLFYDPTGKEKSSKKKSIKEFITANNVKVEAISTQESVRGRVFGQFRPDFVVFDDFENEKTKDSFLITSKIQKMMDESRTGMASYGNICYLCNYISDVGSVQALLDSARSNPKLLVRRVDVVMNGEIMWPDKYVHMDADLQAANSGVVDPMRKKVSLETKKRELNDKGRPVFEQEMLNQPIVKGDRLFDVDLLKLKKEKDVRPAKDISGDWRFWADFVPSHRYGLGADVSEGVGRDSCTAVIIDFSTNPRASVVATFQSDRIAPDMFAYEIKRGGSRFGECIVAPEINNHGWGTLTKLKEIYRNIYEREEDREEYIDSSKPALKLGWQTNKKTKPDMMYGLKSAIEDNLLEIPDENIFFEAMGYGRNDLQVIGAKDGMTKHFDLLIATAIAWQMNAYARVGYAYAVQPQLEAANFDRFEIL